VNDEFWPSDGQSAVVEVARGGSGSRPAALTGVVIVDAEREWGIELRSPSSELDDGALVTVSIFAHDALYRLRGTAHYRWAGCLALRPIYEVDRIQRRLWPRFAIDVDVTLAAMEGSDADFTGVTGRTIDISVGGLQVQTEHQLRSGADPTVVLTLPDGGRLVARARVVHSDVSAGGYRYRLAFDQIEDGDTTRIMALAGSSA
jgi:c-di-GMP-binding flagellar brake protein YcgR